MSDTSSAVRRSSAQVHRAADRSAPQPAPVAPTRDEIEADVVVLLARAASSALRSANALLDPHGLRARHFAVLRLASARRGIGQRRIAVHLGLDPSAVVALVDDLQERGLVRRRADPEDRRSNLIRATPAGVRLLDELAPIATQAQANATHPLDTTQRDQFIAMLRQIVD